jgi:hypothetical protein
MFPEIQEPLEMKTQRNRDTCIFMLRFDEEMDSHVQYDQTKGV